MSICCHITHNVVIYVRVSALIWCEHPEATRGRICWLILNLRTHYRKTQSSFSYLCGDSRPAAEQGRRAWPPSFPRRRWRRAVGRPWWTLSLLFLYLMAASLRGHFCCLMEVVQSHLDTINRTECSLVEIRSNLFLFLLWYFTTLA